MIVDDQALWAIGMYLDCSGATAWIMGGIDKAPQALLKLMNFENP